jgi:hypothetical protein
MANQDSVAGLEPGRALDARVGELLGFAPRISWEVLTPDESATAFTTERRGEAEKWLRDHLAQYPHSWVKDHHVGTWRHYPLVSRQMDAAWDVVLKVIELYGARLSVTAHLALTPDGGSFQVSISGGRIAYADPSCSLTVSAPTAPLAICRAVLLTLAEDCDAE